MSAADPRLLPLLDGPLRFEGAVSLQRCPDGVSPWRLPCDRLDLFHPSLAARAAASPSGVRATLVSDTTSLSVETLPADAPRTWDLLVDGVFFDRRVQAGGDGRVCFDKIGGGVRQRRRLELYLPPQYVPMRVQRVLVDADALAEPWFDARPRWVIYGSSIEHAKEAFGPSETWPALVARRFDLHLTNLGYGGQEHLEIPVARMIRDLPADVITLCVGGNVWGSRSLSARSYRAAVLGLVMTIRDRHPTTPIAVVTFIHTKHDVEPLPNTTMTLTQVRELTASAVRALQDHGDGRVCCVEGSELFGPADMPLMAPDQIHPGGEGQRLMAERFAQRVMPRLLAMR